MNFKKGPAILGVLTAIVVVVVVLLISGGEDAETPPADTGDQTAETGSGGGGSGGGQDGGESKPGDGSSSNSGSEAADEPVIEVADGEPVGGVQDLAFEAGDQIRFAVASDTADEVHFHGYDIEQEIPAGGETQFDVPADLQGVFEVELHGSETQIAEVTVSP